MFYLLVSLPVHIQPRREPSTLLSYIFLRAIAWQQKVHGRPCEAKDATPLKVPDHTRFSDFQTGITKDSVLEYFGARSLKSETSRRSQGWTFLISRGVY